METRQDNLDELVRILAANPQFTPDVLAGMIAGPDDAVARNGFALKAAVLYKQGAGQAGLDLLEKAEGRFPLLPVPLFLLKYELRHLLGQTAQLPRDYYEYGFKAAGAGQLNLGLEALGTALVLDSNMSMGLLYNPQKMMAAAGIYERVAARSAVPPAALARTRANDRIRIGMVVPNLPGRTVAYSRRVLYFAENMDRSRFSLNVYSTENMCIRKCSLPVLFASKPSQERGVALLNRLKELEVPAYIADRSTGIVDTAQDIAGRIGRDGIDVLILQAGPAMPIDWLAVRLAHSKVKLHIHIGSSAYLPGMYATLFDNEVNMRREEASWPGYAGRQILLRRGTDIEAFDRCRPADRSRLGVPSGAVVIGTLSNHLKSRLSPACCDAICDVLLDCPEAWYLGVGGNKEPGSLIAHFRKRGVLEKAVFLPQQLEPGRALKALDIYANEFPVGGSQSVVEAMTCGLPVVAMRCGDAHHESVGADIIGPPFAIQSYAPQQYRQRLELLVRDREVRIAEGRALRKRAEALFSVKDFVRKVCDMGAEAMDTALTGA